MSKRLRSQSGWPDPITVETENGSDVPLCQAETSRAATPRDPA